VHQPVSGASATSPHGLQDPTSTVGLPSASEIEQYVRAHGAQMRNIAREMNFSETTFVTAETEDRATARIFTPASELPFAGHPTLGTAWLLAGGTGTFTLDLAGGAVPVSLVEGVGWMTPPPVALGGVLDPERTARLIGLGGPSSSPPAIRPDSPRWARSSSSSVSMMSQP
jgi:predicted PhzF superfamily epimerase YddE/YHI9